MRLFDSVTHRMSFFAHSYWIRARLSLSKTLEVILSLLFRTFVSIFGRILILAIFWNISKSVNVYKKVIFIAVATCICIIARKAKQILGSAIQNNISYRRSRKSMLSSELVLVTILSNLLQLTLLFYDVITSRFLSLIKICETSICTEMHGILKTKYTLLVNLRVRLRLVCWETIDLYLHYFSGRD